MRSDVEAQLRLQQRQQPQPGDERGVDPRLARQRQQRAIAVEPGVGAGRADLVERAVPGARRGRRAPGLPRRRERGGVAPSRAPRPRRRRRAPARGVRGRRAPPLRCSPAPTDGSRCVALSAQPRAQISRAARARVGEQAGRAAGSRRRAPAAPARGPPGRSPSPRAAASGGQRARAAPARARAGAGRRRARVLEAVDRFGHELQQRRAVGAARVGPRLQRRGGRRRQPARARTRRSRRRPRGCRRPARPSASRSCAGRSSRRPWCRGRRSRCAPAARVARRRVRFSRQRRRSRPSMTT